MQPINVDFILFQPLFLERNVKNQEGPYPLISRPQANLTIQKRKWSKYVKFIVKIC